MMQCEELVQTTGGIAWKNVRKAGIIGKNQIQLLENCSAVVNEGELLAVMGLSGEHNLLINSIFVMYVCCFQAVVRLPY